MLKDAATNGHGQVGVMAPGGPAVTSSRHRREIKGAHLEGSDDSEYKRKLFEALSCRAAAAVRAGEMELDLEPERITFHMLMDDSLKQDLTDAGIT